jgi:hypothetical protein
MVLEAAKDAPSLEYEILIDIHPDAGLRWVGDVSGYEQGFQVLDRLT